MRHFNVYGPSQDPNSPYAAAIAIFSRRALSSEPITIYGDSNQTRDFVFIEDVVRANMLAARQGHGILNVASGCRITVNSLVDRIKTIARSGSHVLHQPERAGDVRHSRGDATRLDALGWKPMVPLEVGLKRTIFPEEESANA